MGLAENILDKLVESYNEDMGHDDCEGCNFDKSCIEAVEKWSEVKPLVSMGQRAGKSFAAYQELIAKVKAGLNPLIIGEGYVVMSHDQFKKLQRNIKNLI